jgi:hypothetical protein
MNMLRKGLAVAAFLLYAGAALLLVREHPAAWSAESESSLPAAISYAVYGTPLGAIDSNVLQTVDQIYRTRGITPSSVDRAVEIAGRGDIPRGDAIATTNDGIGAGQLLFMSFAMKLFGAHLSSLTYFFLLLMGVSTLTFVARFRDDRLFMAPLTFFALSILLLTPVFLDQNVADQVPIGGNRFFGILGVLPALHLYFELLEEPRDPPAARRNLVLAGIQVILLVLALVVRSGAGYLLGLIALAAFLRIRTARADRRQRLQFYRTIGIMLIPGVVLVAIFLTLIPSYVKAGRAFGNLWHRAFVSFAYHPDWPFGNLREVYFCTNIPEGLNRQNVDGNGHCMWVHYASNRGLSDREIIEGVYGGEYEAAARAALFNVIWSYPQQAFVLYAYYKPSFILRTLGQALAIDVRRSPLAILSLVLAQTLLFTAFVIHGVLTGHEHATSKLVIIPVLFLLSLPPQLVAWSNLSTSVDVIFYMYATFAVILTFIVQAAILRGRAPAPRPVSELP